MILNSIDAIEERKVNESELPGKIVFSVANNEQYTELKVKDNGIGISENLRTKIFDPFFTTKEPGKGTGLGLYVSYNLLRDMGGNLSVISEEGSGSEFILSFKKPYISK